MHYFIRDAGLEEPLHRHRKANWPRLQHFLYHSGFEAFVDYPVRAYFREIVHEFPEAQFILTTRQDVETWRSSMKRYFAEKRLDLDLLQAFHVAWNEEIRALCAETGSRFIEICIDDDSKKNSTQLAKFLGFQFAPLIPHLNRSERLQSGLAYPSGGRGSVVLDDVA